MLGTCRSRRDFMYFIRAFAGNYIRCECCLSPCIRATDLRWTGRGMTGLELEAFGFVGRHYDLRLQITLSSTIGEVSTVLFSACPLLYITQTMY